MKQLKLILLSIILLASQLNGIMVQFLDYRRPIEINDVIAKAWLDSTQIARANETREIIKLKIKFTDFEEIKMILTFIVSINDALIKQKVTENQAIKDLTDGIKKETEKNPNFIKIVKEVNDILMIRILTKTLAASFPNQLPQTIKLLLEDGGEITLDSSIYKHFKTLTTMLEVSETEENTIPIPHIKHLKSIENLKEFCEIINTQRPISGIIQKIQTYTLEELNDTLGAAIFLDLNIEFIIRELIGISSQKLQEPAALAEFKNNTDEFSMKYPNFNNPDYRVKIIKKILPYEYTYKETELSKIENIEGITPLPDGSFITITSFGKIIHWTLTPDITISPNAEISEFSYGKKTYIPVILIPRLSLVGFGNITAIAASSPNKIILGTDKGNILVYAKSPGSSQYLPGRVGDIIGKVDSITELPNGNIITSNGNHELDLWEKGANDFTYNHRRLEEEVDIPAPITTSITGIYSIPMPNEITTRKTFAYIFNPINQKYSSYDITKILKNDFIGRDFTMTRNGEIILKLTKQPTVNPEHLSEIYKYTLMPNKTFNSELLMEIPYAFFTTMLSDGQIITITKSFHSPGFLPRDPIKIRFWEPMAPKLNLQQALMILCLKNRLFNPSQNIQFNKSIRALPAEVRNYIHFKKYLG